MEETLPKKRGRKPNKPVIDKEEAPKEPKKRGRKKKYESTPYQTNFISETIFNKSDSNDSEKIDESKYTTNSVQFGNLFIKVHDKEEKKNPDDFFKDNHNSDCELYISSDEELEETTTKPVIKNKPKSILVYDKNQEKSTAKISKMNCFNCHHPFDNKPFYLPFDYSEKLDRFKIYGNFCSPNCVKSYCLHSKQFENKIWVVGMFYRRLFGQTFRIKAAPCVMTLNTYGGKLTIEEYRKSFYTNDRYTLNTVNSKIVQL